MKHLIFSATAKDFREVLVLQDFNDSRGEVSAIYLSVDFASSLYKLNALF
jgi:hypothetical protein